MTIANLTPHGISLFPAATIAALAAQPGGLQFERLTGGHLSVLGSGYTRWPKSEHPARVAEERSEISQLSYPCSEWLEGPGAGPDGCGVGETPITRTVPVRTVAYGAITGLPDPMAGALYIVSLPVVYAARSQGRITSDLLTPGDLIRDAHGEIVGVTSFHHW